MLNHSVMCCHSDVPTVGRYVTPGSFLPIKSTLAPYSTIVAMVMLISSKNNIFYPAVNTYHACMHKELTYVRTSYHDWF